jgi:AcrR family transcriptional regulator
MSRGHSSNRSPLFQSWQAEQLPHLKEMGRRERRAAETRVRIFRSAMRLFAERGLSSVTVEDITEAADVGKGTFFNYFESKEHVLSVLAEIQLGKIREAKAAAESGKQPIVAVLRRMSQQIAEEPGRSGPLARAIISTFLASEPVRSQIANSMAEGRRLLGRIIELGQRRGEISSRGKPERLARIFQQAALGTMLLWSVRADANLQTWMEETFQHFWRGLSSGKA